jgi:hypothetical protein
MEPQARALQFAVLQDLRLRPVPVVSLPVGPRPMEWQQTQRLVYWFGILAWVCRPEPPLSR